MLFPIVTEWSRPLKTRLHFCSCEPPCEPSAPPHIFWLILALGISWCCVPHQVWTPSCLSKSCLNFQSILWLFPPLSLHRYLHPLSPHVSSTLFKVLVLIKTQKIPNYAPPLSHPYLCGIAVCVVGLEQLFIKHRSLPCDQFNLTLGNPNFKCNFWKFSIFQCKRDHL